VRKKEEELICPGRFILAATVCSALLAAHPCPEVIQHKLAQGTEAETKYKYDTSGIRLDGVLEVRKVYGPPGYGETPTKDARIEILVLKLRRGITVEPVENAAANRSANLDPVEHVQEVQLFVTRSKMPDARKLVGQLISATGTLNESMAASQYTKVWLNAATIEPKQ
jgi:hypothetical protein